MVFAGIRQGLADSFHDAKEHRKAGLAVIVL
jgi:hypothetical protein